MFGGASKLAHGGGRVDVDPKRCVLVGYGPVGRSVDARLRAMDIAVTVVELNLETVRALKADRQSAVYGDALKRVTLEEANLASAGMLVISTELEDAAELVRQARRLNPMLRAFVRCSHVADIEPLRAAGAIAVAAELEVAMALTDAVEQSSLNGVERIFPLSLDDAVAAT